MRVLIIAKEFPPFRSARAQQAGKLAAALAAGGATVHVVAGQATHDAAVGIPGVESCYVPYFDGPTSLPLLRRIIRLARQFFDIAGLAAWPHAAAHRAAGLIGAFKPDVVLSQSVPFDSHRAAALLKRWIGLPWAAFFSDPWPLGLMAPPYCNRELAVLTWMQARDARRVLRAADMLIAPTEEILGFMRKNGLVDPAVAGFSIPHIGNICEINGPDPVVLHAGEITRERASAASVAGLAEAARRLAGDGATMVFLGQCDSQFVAAFSQACKLGAAEFPGQVSPEVASAAIARAKVLVILEADCVMSPFMPSKLADYAMTGRPIVAITPAGSAVRRLAGGLPNLHVADHDAVQIANAVITAWNAAGADPAITGSVFAASNVAARYLEVFETMLTRSDGSPTETPAFRGK